jgi:hypothetical protein
MSKRTDQYELLRIASLAGNQDAIDALAEIERQRDDLESVDEAEEFKRMVKKKLRSRMATYEANRQFQAMTMRDGMPSIVGKVVTGVVTSQLPKPLRQIAQNTPRLIETASNGTRPPATAYNAARERYSNRRGKQGGNGCVTRLVGCAVLLAVLPVVIMFAVVLAALANGSNVLHVFYAMF